MLSTLSKHLTTKQIRGFVRAGDFIIPGDDALPAFSQTGFERDIDRILDYMSDKDRADLQMLLGIFGVVPGSLIRLVLATAAAHRFFPKPLGPLLRFLDIGVKGLYFTLYYTNKDIHRRIGWETFISRESQTPKEDFKNKSENPFMHLKDTASQLTTSDEIKEVYRRARESAPKLRDLGLDRRLSHIQKLKQVILTSEEQILDAIQRDTGKSRTDAYVSEIFATLDHLTYLEKAAGKALADEAVPTPITLLGKKSRIYYEPLGTVLVISPWNYPFAMAMIPATTAFVAGNCVVYKPSEYTPLKGLVESLLRDAEFAQDWLQVIYGDGLVGEKLIQARPDKILFTGSGATGRKVMTAAASQLIPVDLELGGKDPMLVFADANIERAAAGALWGGLTNMGQACTSVERLYIEAGIYENFKAALLRQAQRLQQTNAGDKSQMQVDDIDLGHMTTTFQVKKVKEHLDDALARGASLLTGKDWNGESAHIPPLILENVTKDMLVAREETFGPVLPLFKFRDENEALALANDSDYGLSASVWTHDISRAERVTRLLKVGNVSINNVMLTEGNAALPFGGVKDSGFGRYKGVLGLRTFCNAKAVLIDKNSAKIEANWFPYTPKKLALFKAMTQALCRGGLVSFIKFIVTALQLESYSNKVGKRGR